MNDMIIAAAQLAFTVAAFLVGKYVFPRVTADVQQKLSSLSAWAVEFVTWAKEFMQQSSGEDKMAAVVRKLQEIAKEAGWEVTEDQLKAIVQSAYNAMKAGEATATAMAMPLEEVTIPATTVVINTTATPTVTTEVATEAGGK